ncbi:hypothetical protein GIB67_008257 [Kingdonia uniflora]|uniref:Uncharacterized protein n=1 Tax=Kingdonia uniflora TaxID=39325 RepID=A0A7J7N5D8_9MAGN|nr:hypothetical protein GIB67_008257 [Kingdonia uniflora]
MGHRRQHLSLTEEKEIVKFMEDEPMGKRLCPLKEEKDIIINMGSRWSELSEGLLGLITKQLDRLGDFCRFGAVPIMEIYYYTEFLLPFGNARASLANVH